MSNRMDYDHDDYVIECNNFAAVTNPATEATIDSISPSGRDIQILGVSVFSTAACQLYVVLGSDKKFPISVPAAGVSNIEIPGRIPVTDGASAELIVAAGITGTISAALIYAPM